MTLVLKVDGEWRAQSGVVELTKSVATYTATYHDGRVEELICDPYPVTAHVDIGKAEALMTEGTWTEEDLDAIGLKVPLPFTAPEGKRAVGEARYVESKGVVSAVYDVEDIPPPPAEPSKEERLTRLLGDYGLDLDDLKQALAQSEK